MQPTRRKILLIVSGLAAIAVLAGLLRPPSIAVQTARAERGPLRVTLDASGETRIHPRYVVAAPVAGRLAPLGLHEGDEVGQGDAVARITPLPLDRRARQQAEAALLGALAGEAESRARFEEARAAHDLAQRMLARSEALAGEGQVALEALDRARAGERAAAKAVEAARFRAEAARCQSDSARAALIENGAGATLDLCSPADGRVLRLFEDSERVVAAGAPILEIGDPSQLEVVIDVLSADAMEIPENAPVILDERTDRSHQAQVRRVEPSAYTKVSPLGIEEQRVNVLADFLGPIPDLGDRYRVEASIVLWEGADVLRVPAGAIFRSGEGWAVFVHEGRRARLREVRIGHRNPDAVEVLEGLAAGANVIVHPGDRVREGARVRTSS